MLARPLSFCDLSQSVVGHEGVANVQQNPIGLAPQRAAIPASETLVRSSVRYCSPRSSASVFIPASVTAVVVKSRLRSRGILFQVRQSGVGHHGFFQRQFLQGRQSGQHSQRLIGHSPDPLVGP